jgi:hypothetical protein
MQYAGGILLQAVRKLVAISIIFHLMRKIMQTNLDIWNEIVLHFTRQFFAAFLK